MTYPPHFFVRSMGAKPLYAYFDRSGRIGWTDESRLAGRFERWEAIRIRDNFREQGAAVTTEVDS